MSDFKPQLRSPGEIRKKPKENNKRKAVNNKQWDRSFAQNQQPHEQSTENESIQEPQQKTKNQASGQNTKKSQKNGFISNTAGKIGNSVDKMTAWSDKHLDNSKFGGPFNESIVPRRQKQGQAQSPAQQAKQNFEDKMLAYKENLKSEPIKQRYNESAPAFRRRQQREDDENPDNVKDRSLANVAGTRAKNEAHRQVRKGTDFAKKKGNDYLAKHPMTAAKIKEAKEKAEEFKKRRSEQINKLIENKRRIAARYNEIKNRINVKKRAEDWLKKAALQLAAAASRIALQAVIALTTALSEVIVLIFLITVAFVVILVIYDHLCNSGGFTGAACSAIGEVGSLIF